ncbi:MAG: redox-sensing transcriptional repressor Rex [Acidimicrobiaceae bacterium]|nr:redox-sensing transcriptional repressor Rex [Acidimicrobiaceae bacterium]
MAPLGRIPEATVARLPLYLRGLDAFPVGVTATVSSDELADLAGVNAAKVRKDLSHLGTYGTRGVGYDATFLRFQISQALGVANVWPVVVCGMGNLGRALANHTGFTDRGFPVVAATDSDPGKIGTIVDGVPVHAPGELGDIVRRLDVAIGVISTPAEAAQGTADALVAAGVTSIMSFTPTVLSAPDEVEIRSVDLATELQILGFHLHRDRIAGDS